MSKETKILREIIAEKSNCLRPRDTPSNAVVTVPQRRLLRILERLEKAERLLQDWMDDGFPDVETKDFLRHGVSETTQEQERHIPLADVLQSLCIWDTRNPNSQPRDEDDPAPREPGCACENCFYGRDRLAIELLRSVPNG